MSKNLNRVLKLAEKLTAFAEQRIRKELSALVKSRAISTKDARQILKKALKEARQEQRRIRKFIAAELRRELAKAKPTIKKALATKKKQFEAYRKQRRS